MGRVFCGGLFEKSPPHPPKTPQTKGIATLGRKGEHSHSLFRAAKGSFRAPVLQYKFRFVPLPLMDFFEASPGRGLGRPRNDILSAKEPPPTDDIHLRWMKSLRDEILLRRMNSRGELCSPDREQLKKAPLCKGSSAVGGEGLSYNNLLLFTIPPSRFASHLPICEANEYTKGG